MLTTVPKPVSATDLARVQVLGEPSPETVARALRYLADHCQDCGARGDLAVRDYHVGGERESVTVTECRDRHACWARQDAKRERAVSS